MYSMYMYRFNRKSMVEDVMKMFHVCVSIIVLDFYFLQIKSQLLKITFFPQERTIIGCNF